MGIKCCVLLVISTWMLSTQFHFQFSQYDMRQLTPITARSRAKVYGRLLVGIVVSNLPWGMDVCCECCVLSLRRGWSLAQTRHTDFVCVFVCVCVCVCVCVRARVFVCVSQNVIKCNNNPLHVQNTKKRNCTTSGTFEHIRCEEHFLLFQIMHTIIK